MYIHFKLNLVADSPFRYLHASKVRRNLGKNIFLKLNYTMPHRFDKSAVIFPFLILKMIITPCLSLPVHKVISTQFYARVLLITIADMGSHFYQDLKYSCFFFFFFKFTDCLAFRKIYIKHKLYIYT